MEYDFPTAKAPYVWRGLTHACPRCGNRKTHHKYFNIKKNCDQCGLKFEKEHGYWTGAIAINFLITGGLIVIGLVLGLVLTAPDIAVLPLMAVLLPIAIFVPVLAYPFTHTIWMAIDYGFMSRLDS